MSTYLIFFGKSQDFTTCYYDRYSPIHEFNAVIKDFDLLESKFFTVDDIKNKEILSRYFFTAQGRSYCLLKLYSFAQAYNGNRIAGSIYGVGLLSDNAIHLSKNNLELLRVAKDNFAKLSLDGVKFNKSDFKDDTDRIWKAIVSNNDGNLLDKIATSPLRINGSEVQVSFFVKDLFSDAVKLNDRISEEDSVYFSEDLEHLKRTQNKWGKESFPIYWEQNNQFLPYKEPVVDQKAQSVAGFTSSVNSESQVNDIVKLRADLSDSQYIIRNLHHDLEKIKDKYKLFTYIVYGLLGLAIFLLLYIFFFLGYSSKEVVVKPSTSPENFVQNQGQSLEFISIFLTDDKSVDSGIVFLKAAQFIYSFDVQNSAADSSKFYSQFQRIQNISVSNKIRIADITEIYLLKSEELKKTVLVGTKPIIRDQLSGESGIEKKKNKGLN